MARLPDYLQALTDLMDQDIDTVSSGELAAAAGVNAAQLRRDLSYLGSYGVRGVGYDTAHLAAQIGARLGVGRVWPVVIIGAGRLGQALVGYPGLADGSFQVIGLFDRDERLIGSTAGRLTIRHVDHLPDVVAAGDPAIGIIATSTDGAQEACDALVAAGVTSVLTFAHGNLQVAQRVHVRYVDVVSELSVLAFRTQSPTGAQAVETAAAAETAAAGETGAAGDVGAAVAEPEREGAR